ncbi:Hypothetical predicted protein, partial [Olea europaea subsp. europaea]
CVSSENGSHRSTKSSSPPLKFLLPRNTDEENAFRQKDGYERIHSTEHWWVAKIKENLKCTKEDEGNKLPINLKTTDSSDSPIEDKANSSMNIFDKRSGDKRNCKQRKEKAKKTI